MENLPRKFISFFTNVVRIVQSGMVDESKSKMRLKKPTFLQTLGYLR